MMGVFAATAPLDLVAPLLDDVAAREEFGEPIEATIAASTRLAGNQPFCPVEDATPKIHCPSADLADTVTRVVGDTDNSDGPLAL